MYFSAKSTSFFVWYLVITLCVIVPVTPKMKSKPKGTKSKNPMRTTLPIRTHTTPIVSVADSSRTQTEIMKLTSEISVQSTTSHTNPRTTISLPSTSSVSTNTRQSTSIKPSESTSTKNITTTKSPSGSTPSDLGNFSIGCQSNEWLNVDGMCYLFMVTELLSFDEAENYCQKYKAHLVSMHSLTSNYKLSKITWKKAHMIKVHPSAYWIGMKLKPLKNLIVPHWTDNSLVDFSNYLLPPETPSSQDRCTEIQYMANEWRGADCSNTNHFICAIPAAKSKPSTKAGAQSKSTGKTCVCAGCIACYVFVAILGLIILLMTRKCFWSLVKTRKLGGRQDYAYKAVMKDLSKDGDDESDEDF